MNGGTSKPTVCIVILSYNRMDLLDSCLDSIDHKTDYPTTEYDVVVVDNGSDDESVAVAKSYGTSVICNDQNLGFSIANNQALSKFSDYNYHLLLNNDTEVKHGWLSRLVDTAEAGSDVGIVGPKLVYPDGETIQSAGLKFPELTNYREGTSKEAITQPVEEDGVLGAAMLIDHRVIEDIGYLDETFSLFLHEESDYCHRARASGWRIILEPRSVIVHKERQTTQSEIPSVFEYRMEQKNHLKYQFMNGSHVFAVEHQIRQIYGALVGSSGNSPSALVAAYAEVVVDLPDLLYKRHHRSKFVPSYYVDGDKNYAERYSSAS